MEYTYAVAAEAEELKTIKVQADYMKRIGRNESSSSSSWQSIEGGAIKIDPIRLTPM